MGISEPGEGTKPVVFTTPTLGNPVRLGELYDQRSGLFLGVQLYSEDNVQVVETDIRNTELTLSLSTTQEEKASLLDVYAKLSLEVMSGAVSVSGSAQYVKDTKSNTSVQAFALALKMRLNEKRILFAEEKLGRNVLDIVSQDYINKGLATHFVSGITQGGNVIINLIAKQSELETDEKIEGQLQLKLNNLKGAISLDAEVNVGIKDSFKSMDDKFDLIIHGDVSLDKVPINPQDVLDIIPEAASLITENGGVPISVQLQPIPEALIIGSKVHEIDLLFVDEVLKAFSLLDDVRSRFAVLVEGSKPIEDFAPELSRVVRAASIRFTNKHAGLLYELRNFLSDYQHGKPLTARWKPEDPDDPDEHIPVLTDAQRLYNYNIGVVDEDDEDGDGEESLSDYYPSTLVGLEEELAKFQGFASDVRQSTPDLDDAFKNLVILSSFDNVSKAIRLQSKIPLFLMSPFNLPDDNTSTDLSMIRFLAILRRNAEYFSKYSNSTRILYAETLEVLQNRLPSLYEKFSDDGNKPNLFIGEVGVDGTLTWSDPPPLIKLCTKLIHKPSSARRGDLSYSVEPINGKASFSIQIRAKPASAVSEDESKIVVLKTVAGADFLQFRMQPLSVVIYRNYDPSPVPIEVVTPPSGREFVATFVQNVDVYTWTLYVGDRASDPVSFTGTPELLNNSDKVQVVYSATENKWWSGELTDLRAFSYALTPEQLEAELKKP